MSAPVAEMLPPKQAIKLGCVNSCGDSPYRKACPRTAGTFQHVTKKARNSINIGVNFSYRSGRSLFTRRGENRPLYALFSRSLLLGPWMARVVFRRRILTASGGKILTTTARRRALASSFPPVAVVGLHGGHQRHAYLQAPGRRLLTQRRRGFGNCGGVAP